MTTDFEPIYAALFALVSGADILRTSSRRMRPALFMAQGDETPLEVRGVPSSWTLNVELFIYTHTGNSQRSIPSQQINAVLAKIRAALVPDQCKQVNDLGLPGVVSHCAISGSVEIFDGTLGAQAVAIVPVRITLA